MPSYQVSIEFAVPPAAVFAAASDLPGHGTWSADELEVIAVDDARVGAGKRYRSVAKSKGKTFEAGIEVTEYRAPERFAFTVHDFTGDYTHVFTVAARDGGTRLTRAISGQLSVAQALLFYLVYLPVKRPNARRALARLKERLEA